LCSNFYQIRWDGQNRRIELCMMGNPWVGEVCHTTHCLKILCGGCQPSGDMSCTSTVDQCMTTRYQTTREQWCSKAKAFAVIRYLERFKMNNSAKPWRVVPSKLEGDVVAPIGVLWSADTDQHSLRRAVRTSVTINIGQTEIWSRQGLCGIHSASDGNNHASEKKQER